MNIDSEREQMDSLQRGEWQVKQVKETQRYKFPVKQKARA